MNKRYRNREIDSKHQELRSDIRNVRQDLKNLRTVVESGFEESNHRLSKLERWRNYIAGALAIIGPVATAVAVQFVTQNLL